VYAALTALAISFLIGGYIIRKLKERKIGQLIRSDGPSTHRVKEGTPTMGGLIILLSMVASVLLWARPDNPYVIVVFLAVVWFGALGFVDDYLKFFRQSPKGLIMRYKLLGQILGAVAIAVFLYYHPASPQWPVHVKIPLLKSPVNFGWLYFLFIVFVIVGSSNAVNLTDGLDGLAIGTFIFSAMAFSVVAYLVGHVKFSEYLKIIHIGASSELTVFCAAMVGASLGFLWYNSHPAEVFMGDVGSLALGGALGTIAVMIKQELLLILICGIFVVEAVSVILQIISFRFFQKRIFLMAPLHHHFEVRGMPESKIVIRFWILAIIFALASLSLLKLR